MKQASRSIRLLLLAGTAAALALQPLPPLHADDKGGGSHHEGGDDKGGGGGTGGGGDDKGGGATTREDHGKTEFLGTIQALPNSVDLTGAWTVDDRAVTVDAATLIRTEHGQPAVGGKVEVEGIVQADGTVLASSVKTEDAAMEREDNVFFGLIQSLPTNGIVGVWQVSGLTVLVSSDTRVETEGGGAAIGALVRVEGIQQPDASIAAGEIQIQDDAAAAAQAADVVKIKGAIEHVPATRGGAGNWVVDGVVVTVTDDSVRVAGGRKAKAGRQVVIKGRRQLNGSVLAGKVHVPRKEDVNHP